MTPIRAWETLQCTQPARWEDVVKYIHGLRYPGSLGVLLRREVNVFCGILGQFVTVFG